ncbi:MAG: hypothetical protein CMQ51_01010 [Gammaproteobacteria bacterium]|nr:hypothetical protein [Gammaproteobacteria bacterium]
MILKSKKVFFIFSLAFISILFSQLSYKKESYPENIIIGKPTNNSIMISIMAIENTAIYINYGLDERNYTNKTEIIHSSKDQTAIFNIDKLMPNTQYYYRANYKSSDNEKFYAGDTNSFWTQRSIGSSFTFGVQGDSHPERLCDEFGYGMGISANQRNSGEARGCMYDPELYKKTLRMVDEDRPDLYFMLGDDFSISNLLPNYFQGDDSGFSQSIVDDIYINQRNFLRIMANSTALFPVNGNHEEARLSLLNTPLHNSSIFAGNARNRYFPVPTPNTFYSGNEKPIEGIGLLGDYFSFRWGDALFISIDPYWHSTRVTERIGGMGISRVTRPEVLRGTNPGANTGGMDSGTAMGVGTKAWAEIEGDWIRLTQSSGNLWDATIGDRQYQFLKKTLEESDAKYKFIFMHHVLGTGRGGVERATKYEWGGYNDKDEWEFDQERPSWGLPIHQLLVKNNVSIVFQAHDHLFAKQELDGIIYQSVPNPADPGYQEINFQAYKTGDLLPNSGYLNVEVSPENVKVTYKRSYLDKDETDSAMHGQIDYQYTIN